jgi:hypothetical protein
VTKKLRQKIITQNVAEVSASYRSLGKKYDLHKNTVKKVFINNGGIRKKRKKCPKSDEKQKLRQKKCLNKLTKRVGQRIQLKIYVEKYRKRLKI